MAVGRLILLPSAVKLQLKGNTMNISKILEGKKTYIGIITAILGLFLGEADVDLAIDGLDKILELVGLVIAFYGRMKSKGEPQKVVTVPGPKDPGDGG